MCHKYKYSNNNVQITVRWSKWRGRLCWIAYRDGSCAVSLKVKSLKVADIIRGGLRRFTDSLGQLWCSLADYFIRSGHFEKVKSGLCTAEIVVTESSTDRRFFYNSCVARWLLSFFLIRPGMFMKKQFKLWWLWGISVRLEAWNFNPIQILYFTQFHCTALHFNSIHYTLLYCTSIHSFLF